ncbi:MAG: hypothetical protein AB1489_12515 [Acidobacteriota bacterium]
MSNSKKKKLSPPSKSKSPIVLIHESLIQDSVVLLQQAKDETSAHECILYWAGKSLGSEWIITTCIVPRAETTWGSFITSAASNAEVIAFLALYKLELLAQVHTHPEDLVDHSAGDDAGALMPFENFLSIVVPKYGSAGILPLNQCGVHRYESGRFRRLSNVEIEVGFKLIPIIHNFNNHL